MLFSLEIELLLTIRLMIPRFVFLKPLRKIAYDVTVIGSIGTMLDDEVVEHFVIVVCKSYFDNFVNQLETDSLYMSPKMV